MKVLKRILDRVKGLYKREPARASAILAAAVVFFAAESGLVVEEQDVLTALAYILPILLGGEITRAKVSPVK